MEARNTMIKVILKRTSVSIRQLARTLGMGKNIIERVVQTRQTKRPPVFRLLLDKLRHYS